MNGEVHHTVLWLLGFLLCIQMMVVLLSLYAYRFLEPATRKAWPFFVASCSLIIIRRLMGSARWDGIYNMVVLENVVLILISLGWMIFILKCMRK